MPALPDVPSVVRLDQFFSIAEDARAKVRSFWKYFSGPPTATELNAAASVISAAWGAAMKSLFADDRSLIEIVLTDLSSTSGAIGSDGTTIVGTRAGAGVPADQAVLRSGHVLRRFRGGHPREYWPMGGTGDLGDAQTWSTALVDAAATGLGTYDTDIGDALSFGSGAAVKVNVSYYEGFTVHVGTTGRARNVSTVRSVPVVDNITSQVVQSGRAVQRRRLLHLA